MWTVIKSLFGGWWIYAILGVAALAFGGYLGSQGQYKADQVVEASLRTSIDDPKTGYRAQISDLSNNLAVCRDTVAKEDKALTAQSADVTAWKAAADKATKVAAQARADASALAREADQLAAALATTKPATVSYVDLEREALQ